MLAHSATWSGATLALSQVDRRACPALVWCWAVAGAGLSLWVFHAWAQSLPSLGPNDGPIGPDANLSFWVGGAAMGVLLAGLSAAAAVTGTVFLSEVRTVRRIWAGWVLAVIAAVAVETAFVGVFIAWGALFGMAPGHADWGFLALSGGFAATGFAMTAIIIVASSSRRPHRDP